MQNLRSKLIRLAAHHPEVRPHLLPLLASPKQAALAKQAVRIQVFNRLLSLPGQFGIMSAYTAAPKSVNKAAQGELIADLQRLRVRYEHLKGQWEGVRENALFIYGISGPDLFDLGRKYNQISVIHKNKSGVVGMYYLKENKVEVAIKPDASIAGEIAQGEDLWSKGRGTSFSFDFLWGQKLPWNGNSVVDKNQVMGWIAQGLLTPQG